MTKVIDLRQKRGKTSRPPTFVIKKTVTSPPQNQPPRIIWEAPSFYFNPQKKYLSMVIIALVFAGSAMLFFSGDMLMAIFLLLSSLVLILYSNKQPEISKITIDPRGITIRDSIHYYKDIRSFWLHYNPNNIKELSLELKKWYMPYVKIPIENKNPLIIRSLLINFLPEREHEHSLVDIIARRIGL